MTVTTAAMEALDRASIGRPITRNGVSLMPVYLHQQLSQTVQTGSAISLRYEELNGGSVPTLRVFNEGARLALIVAGELLEGGLQDRTLNVSVLVSAHSSVDVPVSCVESGRWGRREQGRNFESNFTYAPNGVRATNQSSVARHMKASRSRHSDQGAVWNAVEQQLSEMALNEPSPSGSHGSTSAASHRFNTRSVMASYEHAGRDHKWRSGVEELIDMGPLPNQCGVVVRPRSVDCCVRRVCHRRVACGALARASAFVPDRKAQELWTPVSDVRAPHAAVVR